MNFELLSSIESPILVALKIAALLFLLIYLAFAGILVKQVKIMTDTLMVGLEGVIKSFVYLHFAIALGVFLVAIFIL